MKPEQAKQILADAPEGATHFDEEDGGIFDWIKFDDDTCGGEWSKFTESGWKVIDREKIGDFYSIHALSDLRTIVAQAERIEDLERKLDNANKCFNDVAKKMLGE